MAALGLAACSSTASGQVAAAQSSGVAGGDASSAPASSGPPSSGASPLASVQPCDLLPQSVLDQYQLSRSGSIVIPAARPCNWDKPPDVTGSNGESVEIDVRDTLGLADVVTEGNTVTAENVGSHQGKLLTATAGGSCTVVIGVSSTSRVDIGVTAETDTQRACQVAIALAKVVEPQLPARS